MDAIDENTYLVFICPVLVYFWMLNWIEWRLLKFKKYLIFQGRYFSLFSLQNTLCVPAKKVFFQDLPQILIHKNLWMINALNNDSGYQNGLSKSGLNDLFDLERFGCLSLICYTVILEEGGVFFIL